MAIKIKTKKDIINQFNFCEDGLYKLKLEAKAAMTQEEVETTSVGELAVSFNHLLRNLGKTIENALEEKRVYFK